MAGVASRFPLHLQLLPDVQNIQDRTFRGSFEGFTTGLVQNNRWPSGRSRGEEAAWYLWSKKQTGGVKPTASRLSADFQAQLYVREMIDRTPFQGSLKGFEAWLRLNDHWPDRNATKEEACWYGWARRERDGVRGVASRFPLDLQARPYVQKALSRTFQGSLEGFENWLGLNRCLPIARATGKETSWYLWAYRQPGGTPAVVSSLSEDLKDQPYLKKYLADKSSKVLDGGDQTKEVVRHSKLQETFEFSPFVECLDVEVGSRAQHLTHSGVQ